MATKYLDEDGVQTLWFKVKGYSPGVSESNTFTGTNVFNGETTINQYPVLVAKPHSGYNHTIRQYQYEDYLDFTDNSLIKCPFYKTKKKEFTDFYLTFKERLCKM